MSMGSGRARCGMRLGMLWGALLAVVLFACGGMAKFFRLSATDSPTEDQTGMLYFLSPESVEDTAEPFMRSFESLVVSHSIADYSGTINTSLGKISFELSHMNVGRFVLGELHVSTEPSKNAMYGYIPDSSFSLSFDYSIKELSFPYMSESGSGSLSSDNVFMSSELHANADPDTGGVIPIFDSLDFDIGELNIDINGGLIGGMINTLESLFADIINTFISSYFDQFMEQYVTEYVKEMTKTGMYVCSSNIVCTDYRLTRDPVVTDQGLFGYVSGAIFRKNQRDTMEPVKCSNMPTVPTSYPFSVQLNNAVFQSLLNTLQMENYFSLWNAKTGHLEPTILNYNDIIAYYPTWSEAYPYGTNGALSITTSTNPKSEIMYNGLRITISSNISLAPVGYDDSTHITSDIEIVLVGDLWWRDYHYTTNDIQSDTERMSIDVKLTNIKATEKTISSTWLKDTVNQLYIIQLNKNFYNNYIFIYSYSNLVYINPSVTYNGDYVLINADFS